MACPCGSHILKQRVATHSASDAVYELGFRECDRCGRIGYERLSRATEVIGQGTEARAQFQRLSQSPAQKWAPRVNESMYRPYKIWFTPDRQAIRVCLIKLPSRTVALCPEYRLLAEGDDYLETNFALCRQLIKTLGLPDDTRLSATDSAPFELTWGAKPPLIIDRIRTNPPARIKEQTNTDTPPEESAKRDPAPTPPQCTEPETSNTQPELAETPKPTPSQPTGDQHQLDLFA